MKSVGIGTRVINFFVDTVIIFILAAIFSRLWRWNVMYYRVPAVNFWVIFFTILVLYYAIIESIFNRTPGKWFSYSIVVNKQGQKPSIIQILLRSLYRLIPIDMFFIPIINMPLHDYLSGTMVVEI